MEYTPEQIESEKATIRADFRRGGPFMTQVVRFGLQHLAEMDEVAANQLYEELQKEGY